MAPGPSKYSTWPTTGRKARPSTISQRPPPFYRLPLELVHHIFNIAAASSRRSCLDICLVASWAHGIARPHLFRAIVIEDAITFNNFMESVVNPLYKPAVTNTHLTGQSLVNGVWCQGYWSQPSSLFRVFNVCDNVTHLAMDGSAFGYLFRRLSRLFGSISNDIKGQDLHLVIMGYYVYINPSRKTPIFDRITHICITDVSSYGTAIHGLDQFSRLSHVSLPYCLRSQHDTRDLYDFLELQSLKMLVIALDVDIVRKGHWKKLGRWVRKARETDGRVYLVECGGMSVFREEWNNEVRGGESIWDRAVRYTDEWERAVEPSGMQSQ